MTELIGRNETTVTKALFFEGMDRFSRDTYGRSAKKSMLIFLGLWAALAAWTLWTGGTLTQTLGYLVLIGFIGIWICVILPRSHAKRLWARQEAKFGSSPWRQTDFFHDYLNVSGDGVEKTVYYQDIHQILVTKNLIILVCGDKTAVLLDKKGFTFRSMEEIFNRIEKSFTNLSRSELS